MKVILQETLEGVGNLGDLLDVSPGFARNYLLPRKKAVEADPNYADAYFYRGVLFYTQGPREQALADFERYLELAPDGEHAEEAAKYIENIKVELEALGQ